MIGFLLEIVEAIRNGDVDELLEDRQTLLRVVNEKFEVYGEEVALLVDRNIDHATKHTDGK